MAERAMFRVWAAVMGPDGVPTCSVEDRPTSDNAGPDDESRRLMGWARHDDNGSPPTEDCRPKRSPCAPGAPCRSHIARAIKWWPEWERREIRHRQRLALATEHDCGNGIMCRLLPPLPGDRKKVWTITTEKDGKWHGTSWCRSIAEARERWREKTGQELPDDKRKAAKASALLTLPGVDR